MKYNLVCTRTYETVIPASRLVFHTIHGEQVDGMEVPETRIMNHAGQRYTARKKTEANQMVKSGNWAFES